MNTHQYGLFLKKRKFPKGFIGDLAHRSAMKVRADHQREISERGLTVGAMVQLTPENTQDEIESFTPWKWVRLKNKQIPVPPKDVTLLERISQ